ncbi:cytochrome c oxidase biogenesis protein [Seiridium cupressi]
MASSPKDSSASGSTEHLPMPSRNPLQLLTSQEAQVREVFNARMRRACGNKIKAAPLPSPSRTGPSYWR